MFRSGLECDRQTQAMFRASAIAYDWWPRFGISLCDRLWGCCGCDRTR
ncbi:MAG: hypothetical protein WCD18_22735 [Thermosynechococcaceae cyanobacterium]